MFEKYKTQMALKEIGQSGQALLNKATVVIVGIGGLGCPAAQSLAAAGIGKLILIDGDTIQLSNLSRQTLYNETNVGLLKVKVAKNRLQKQFPDVVIETVPNFLDEQNANSIFKNCDLVVDGTDNVQSRYLINDTCVELNKPFVYGAVHRNEGHVSVFNLNNGPTYRCLFPETDELVGDNCTNFGVLVTLTSVIGNIQANEVIKILLKHASTISGKLLVINLLENNFHAFNIMKSTVLNRRSKLTKEKELSNNNIGERLKCGDPKLLLIDIRESYEIDEDDQFCQVHIPLEELEGRVHELNMDKDIVLVCSNGIRSRAAASLFNRKFPEHHFYPFPSGIQELRNLNYMHDV